MEGGAAENFTRMGTLGIEEEFYVVDEHGRPTSGTDTLVYESEPPAILEDRLDHELFKCVIETQTPLIESLDDALSASEGVDAVLAEDIRVELWRKFAFICAHAGMTATTRRPVGDLRENESSWEMYRRLIEEVCAVARAEGVALPDDTVSEWLDFAADLDPGMYSSLHYDLTHDKPMELDALNGSVVRHADAVGVDVPMNEAVTAILSPWAAGGG